jgi:hypothetical protein
MRKPTAEMIANRAAVLEEVAQQLDVRARIATQDADHARTMAKHLRESNRGDG